MCAQENKLAKRLTVILYESLGNVPMQLHREQENQIVKRKTTIAAAIRSSNE